jgi:DNA-binding NtrC family response regulator
MTKVCIIGCEIADQVHIQNEMRKCGHEVETHENGLSSNPSVVILDLADRPTEAVQTLTLQTKQQFPNIPLLVIFDDRAASRSIDALRLGASHAIIRSAVNSHLSAFVDLVLNPPSAEDPATLFQDFPTLEELEKRYMKVVLEKTLGRKERAAKILGINRRTLYRKEREYGWVADDVEETEL